jgi:hypothetical protein
LALRKIEALFLAIPIVTIAAIAFSAMNKAVDSGATLQGKVLGCSPPLRRGLGWRLCTVDIGNSKVIHAKTQRAKPGDVVAVSKMITQITGTVFYIIRDSAL